MTWCGTGMLCVVWARWQIGKFNTNVSFYFVYSICSSIFWFLQFVFLLSHNSAVPGVYSFSPSYLPLSLRELIPATVFNSLIYFCSAQRKWYVDDLKCRRISLLVWGACFYLHTYLHTCIFTVSVAQKLITEAKEPCAHIKAYIPFLDEQVCLV